MITLPEILGKLSRVPSMKVSYMFMLIQGRRLLDNCGGVGWQKVLNDKF
jgi:hypothetical protein